MRKKRGSREGRVSEDSRKESGESVRQEAEGTNE